MFVFQALKGLVFGNQIIQPVEIIGGSFYEIEKGSQKTLYFFILTTSTPPLPSYAVFEFIFLIYFLFFFLHFFFFLSSFFVYFTRIPFAYWFNHSAFSMPTSHSKQRSRFRMIWSSEESLMKRKSWNLIKVCKEVSLSYCSQTLFGIYRLLPCTWPFFRFFIFRFILFLFWIKRKAQEI